MNEFVKYGLIGVAGYLAYEYLLAPAAATSVVTSAPATSVANTASSAPATQGAVLATAGTMLTTSQWNWYARQANPKAIIIQSAPGDTGAPISYATWQGYFNTPNVLLSGAGVSGLGHIVDLVNLFRGVKSGSGFGEQEFSALGSLGVIENDPLMSASYIDEPPFLEAAAFRGSLNAGTQDFYAAAGV